MYTYIYRPFILLTMFVDAEMKEEIKHFHLEQQELVGEMYLNDHLDELELSFQADDDEWEDVEADDGSECSFEFCEEVKEENDGGSKSFKDVLLRDLGRGDDFKNAVMQSMSLTVYKGQGREAAPVEDAEPGSWKVSLCCWGV